MSKNIYDDDLYDDIGGRNINYEEAYRRQLARYSELSDQSGYEDDYDDIYDDDNEVYEQPRKKGSSYRTSDRDDLRQNFGKNGGGKKSGKSGKNKSRPSRRPEPEQKKKKKTNPVKKFFTVILVLILVIFVGLQFLIWRYIGDIKKVETGERNYTEGSMDSKDVLNILLIGSDSRSMEERGRTDSIILLSIDKTNKKITMTSFMRDIYVTFPACDRDGDGVDDKGKINAANVYGGSELLLDTIEYNFDISVDKYFYVDFFSFAKIVDAVGGIELDISDEEAEGMKAPMAEQNNIFGNKKGTDYLKKGGKGLEVNGNQALAYARLRYVGNADFQRTERQRTVITKIIEKAKTLNPIALDRFIETTLSSLTTNYTSNELYFLSYSAPFMLKYDIKSQRIPDDNTDQVTYYTYGTHEGQSTLDIDFDRAKAQLKERIYRGK